MIRTALYAAFILVSLPAQAETPAQWIELVPGATSHQLAVNVFVHPHAGIGYAYVTNRMSTTLPFFPAVRARCVALAAAAESARSAATAIARPPALAISATSASAASACTA